MLIFFYLFLIIPCDVDGPGCDGNISKSSSSSLLENDNLFSVILSFLGFFLNIAGVVNLRFTFFTVDNNDGDDDDDDDDDNIADDDDADC